MELHPLWNISKTEWKCLRGYIGRFCALSKVSQLDAPKAEVLWMAGCRNINSIILHPSSTPLSNSLTVLLPKSSFWPALAHNTPSHGPPQCSSNSTYRTSLPWLPTLPHQEPGAIVWKLRLIGSAKPPRGS